MQIRILEHSRKSCFSCFFKQKWLFIHLNWPCINHNQRKSATRLQKTQAVMQLPHDGKDLGIVGTLELAGWTLKQHGQFGESWWILRFNPTWSSSFFYPRCQHDCFTELLNFKSCWSISGVTGRIIWRKLYFEALQSCSPSIRSGKDLDPNCQNYRACLLEVAVTDTTSASLASVSLRTIGSFVIETSRKWHEHAPSWFSGFMKFNEIRVKYHEIKYTVIITTTSYIIIFSQLCSDIPCGVDI